jgi:hypothetical protein
MADIECSYPRLLGRDTEDDDDGEGSSQSLLYISDEDSSEISSEDEDVANSSSTTFISDLSNSFNDNDSIILLLDEGGKKTKNILTKLGVPTTNVDPPRKFFMTSSSSTKATTKNNALNDEKRKIQHGIHLEKEKLITLWREEFEAERKASIWYNRMKRQIVSTFATMGRYSKKLRVEAEICIGNLPLTIGAIALSWVTMGIVWFKFVEDLLCSPASFWSTPCLSHESPGCYYCSSSEIGSKYLKAANDFHAACSIFAMALIVAVVAKFFMAWKIVQDDLSNPVTSTPFGAIAMGANTLLCSHHGVLSETLAMGCSFAQVALFLWFLSMALRNRMLPDPSWSPNTISGLCVAATNVQFHAPRMSIGLFIVSMKYIAS